MYIDDFESMGVCHLTRVCVQPQRPALARAGAPFFMILGGA